MKVTTDGCLFGAWCAEEIQKSKSKFQAGLDIGCGTGLLSLMIAQKNMLQIDAVEIDPEAASQAKENVLASPWKESINVIESNILEWNKEVKYDVIISNPPFYENELRSSKSNKNIAHHSDELKLYELLRIIKNNLAEEGNFFLLLPAKREEEIDDLVKEAGLFLYQKIAVKQSEVHPPFRLMIEGGNMAKEPVQSTIAIKNRSNEYTAAFIALLKDYYLYL